MQVARADADERERPLGRRLLDELRPAALGPAGLPQAHARGQEPSLPRVRPDGVAEPCLVVTALEPVRRRLLNLGPAGGELVRRRDLLVGDRALEPGRPDDAVASLAKHANESVQAVEVDDSGGGAGLECFDAHYRDSLDSPRPHGIGTATARRAGMPQSRIGLDRLRPARGRVSLGG